MSEEKTTTTLETLIENLPSEVIPDTDLKTLVGEAPEPYTPQVRDILIWPDEKLKLKSSYVKQEEFDTPELHELIADMYATMKTYEGVGLSAPQIGIQKRIITISIIPGNKIILINPTVTVLDEELFEWEEGCLSVPGYFKKKKRPKTIAVKFQDLSGEEQHVRFDELHAFAVQHEVDHLDGVCFVDDTPNWRKGFVKNKIKKALPKINQRAEEIMNTLKEEGSIQ